MWTAFVTIPKRMEDHYVGPVCVYWLWKAYFLDHKDKFLHGFKDEMEE